MNEDIQSSNCALGMCLTGGSVCVPLVKTISRPKVNLKSCGAYASAFMIAAMVLIFHVAICYFDTHRASSSFYYEELYVFFGTGVITLFVVTSFDESKQSLSYYPFLATWSVWILSHYIWKSVWVSASSDTADITGFFSNDLYVIASGISIVLAIATLFPSVQHAEWIVRILFGLFLILTLLIPRPHPDRYNIELINIQSAAMFVVYTLVNLYVDYESVYQAYGTHSKIMLSALCLIPINSVRAVLVIAGIQTFVFGTICLAKYRYWANIKSGASETYLPTTLKHTLPYDRDEFEYDEDDDLNNVQYVVSSTLPKRNEPVLKTPQVSLFPDTSTRAFQHAPIPDVSAFPTIRPDVGAPSQSRTQPKTADRAAGGASRAVPKKHASPVHVQKKARPSSSPKGLASGISDPKVAMFFNQLQSVDQETPKRKKKRKKGT